MKLVAVEPPDAVADVAQLVGADATVFAQQGSDLSARMCAAMAQAAATRPGPIVLIGTDVPLLTSDRIIEATGLLAAHAALPPAIHAILTSGFEQSCELA